MENKYYFLRSSVPDSEQNAARGTKVHFSGLDMYGTGGVSAGVNFEITPDGTLRTASVPEKCAVSLGGKPLAVFSGSRYLYAVCFKTGLVCNLVRFDTEEETVKTVSLSAGNDSAKKRSLCLYNNWTGGSDIVSGEYEDVLLIFPDKKYIDALGEWGDKSLKALARYDITRTVKTETVVTQNTYNNGWKQNGDGAYTLPAKPDGTKRDIDTKSQSSFYGSQSTNKLPDTIVHPAEFSTTYVKEDVHGTDGSVTGTVLFVTETATTIKETFSAELIEEAIPNADRIVAYNTRLFGVDGNKIFASGAGSYSDYELDTADDFDENNAWYSATPGDAFTALTTFDGRVTAFKPQGLYQAYNTKNPFRIKEISKVGTSFGDTVSETENVLYYANENGIYAFGGSYPKNIALERLDMTCFKGSTATGGAYGGKYYFRRETDFDNKFKAAGTKPVLVYDGHTGAWSVLSFATEELYYYGATEKALYAIDKTGSLWKHTAENRSGAKWYYELPVETGNTADVKKLTRIQAVFRFRSTGKVKVSVAFDNGNYAECGGLERASGVYPVYIPVISGDHVARRIRFEGSGDVELMTLEQIFKTGGTRYGQ